MNHPDIELLTQFALDDPLALDAATLVHITDCAECRHEIEQVQRVVDAALAAGGRSSLRTLESPPPRVWDGIVSAIDADDAADASEREVADARDDAADQRRDGISDAAANWLFAGPGSVSADEPPAPIVDAAPEHRTIGLQLLAAAAVGIVLGAGFTWVLRDPGDEADDTRPDIAATSSLAALGGHTASGEISLSSDASQLSVDLDASDLGKGFVEVWLFDEDSGGMVALGVLDGPQGTFALPNGVDLSAYNQIDISVEPYDGDPLHSADSVARAPLPTVDS